MNYLRNSDRFIRAIAVSGAIGSSLLAGAIFILCIGRDPADVYGTMLRESLGTPYGIGQILFKASTLMCTGLSVALCLRAGFFNIGGEGQVMMGGLAMAITGFLFQHAPVYLLLPACLFAGLVSGAVWGAIPGVLKAGMGANEVITSIMLNFIAAALVSFLVNSVFAVQATVHTPPIGAGAVLPRLEEWLAFFQGTPVNLSLILAFACCFGMEYLLRSTPFGYEIRATGLNLLAARTAHIPTGSRLIAVTAISGAAAALAGANTVLGYKHYFELGYADGAGYIGIVVALLANNRPAAIPLAAMFFGLLEYGGLTINTQVPKELVNILQAIMIIMMAISMRLLNNRRSAGTPVSVGGGVNG